MRTVTIPVGTKLEDLYQKHVGDYPKFFQMDAVCKLGFLVAEMLVKEDPDRFMPRDDRAVLVFSHNGSPALPGPVAEEIAIRNKYQGKTSAFVLEAFEPEPILDQIVGAFQDRVTGSVLVVWIDCPSGEEGTARGWLMDWRDLLPPEEEHHCCHGGGHGGGCCGRHHHEDGDGPCHHEDGEEHHCCHGEGHGEGHCHHEEGEEHHCHCKENNK